MDDDFVVDDADRNRDSTPANSDAMVAVERLNPLLPDEEESSKTSRNSTRLGSGRSLGPKVRIRRGSGSGDVT